MSDSELDPVSPADDPDENLDGDTDVEEEIDVVADTDDVEGGALVEEFFDDDDEDEDEVEVEVLDVVDVDEVDDEVVLDDDEVLEEDEDLEDEDLDEDLDDEDLDEDLDDEEEDDLEDELDELLEEDEEVQPLDEEEVGGKKGAKPRRKVELISEDEFTCRSCFLVKKPSQLADREAMLCYDCV